MVSKQTEVVPLICVTHTDRWREVDKWSLFVQVYCSHNMVVSTNDIYEGWNFNSGNYLFTTDTK